MARRSSAATIAEVARHAGVSASTVSRVMNGRFVGEPDIAERVRESARALAYSPSHLARSLALGHTNAIGFVVPDLANPTFQAMLSSLSKAAAKDGYRVLVADSAEASEDEQLLVAEVRGRCDAIVLCAPRMSDEELLEIAGGLYPLVLINRADTGLAVPSLAIDYESGIRGLVRHLYELGHRHIVYLEGRRGSPASQTRVAGLEYMQRKYRDLTVSRLPTGTTSESGAAVAGRVYDSAATAALAFNDLVAIGLLSGLLELGVKVPEEMSVAGFDDIPFSRFTTPSLTTVSVPHAELGDEAWRRMRALLTGERPGHDIVFQPRVEARGSTARPAV